MRVTEFRANTRNVFAVLLLCVSAAVVSACDTADAAVEATAVPVEEQTPVTPETADLLPTLTIEPTGMPVAVPAAAPTLPPSAADLHAEALDLLNDGDLDQALDMTHAALEHEPDNVAALNTRAAILTMQEEYKAALSVYDRVVYLEPESVAAYSNRGNVLRQMDEYALALEDYNRALLLDPAYTDAYNGRGIIYLKTGAPELALADYERAIDLNPADAKLYANRAAVHADLGRLDTAIEDYTTALEFNDPAPAVTTDDPSDALRNEAQLADWYCQRGDLYLVRGASQADIYDAQDDLEKCLAYNPEHSGALFGLGTIYDELAKLVEQGHVHSIAFEFYEKALAHYRRFVAVNTTQNEAADFAAERIRVLTIKMVRGYFQRAAEYYEAGNYVAAAQDMSSVLELYPEHTRALNNRAWYLAHAGFLYRALVDVNHALEDSPSPYIYDTRGFIYYEMGEYQAALEDHYRAIARGGWYSYYRRGIVWEALGAPDRAFLDYKHLLDHSRGLDTPATRDARERIEAIRRELTEPA